MVETSGLLNGHRRQCCAVNHVASAVVGISGQPATVNPAPNRVITDTQKFGGLTNSKLRHKSSLEPADAGNKSEYVRCCGASSASKGRQHVDDGVGGGIHRQDAGSVTSTGCPGCSFAASAGAGFAWVFAVSDRRVDTAAHAAR